MIQRIQSVYLLIATCAAVVTIFLPWTDLYNMETNMAYTMNFCGLFALQNAVPTYESNVWGMSIFNTAIALSSFVAIFLFKNRKLQKNVCVTTIILVVCFYLSYAFYIFTAISTLQVSVYPYLFVCLPLISLVFVFLAIRGIKHDDKLLSWSDRLR